VAPIPRRRVLLGFGAVAAFLAVDAGAIAAASGYLSDRLSPQRFLDRFDLVNGFHPGFRANHAKGVPVSGYFDATGNARDVSSAAVFERGRRTPVVGRFSLSGGNPMMADTGMAARGLGLAFGYPTGQQWRTAMMDLPVFFVHTPQEFYDRLLALKPRPDTGAPDPAAMASFLATHPAADRAMKLIEKQPKTSGFGDSTYRSLNAFHGVDSDGVRTPLRWSFVPLRRPEPAPATMRPNTLFDGLVRDLKDGPLQWRMLLTIGTPDDRTDDASAPWPEDRRTIEAGTLTLDSLQSSAPDLNFDPMVLPPGLEPSDDPLLPARSAVYTASFRRRTDES
jgi:catalase